MDNGITLDDALSKAVRLEGIAKGMASGRRGLGVRVPDEKFQEVLVKCLGPIEAQKNGESKGKWCTRSQKPLLGLTLKIFNQR